MRRTKGYSPFAPISPLPGASTSPPPFRKGGDAYVLKWIIHDWNDTDATRILRTVRR